jgi:hypothetical protein
MLKLRPSRALFGPHLPHPPPPDSLDAFGSERLSRESASHARPAPALVVGLALLAVLAAFVIGGLTGPKWRPLVLAAAPVPLTIESSPAGAEVRLEGVLRGTTPLTLSVAPGTHALEIVSGERRKTFTASVAAGAAVVHHVDLGAAASAGTSSAAASLRVVTEPASLAVRVDGVEHGASPVTVPGLTPGPHVVEVTGPAGRMERMVELAAGESASVILGPPSASGPAVGWLTIASPVALQVFEGSQMIGTSEASRIMLTAGRHDRAS